MNMSSSSPEPHRGFHRLPDAERRKWQNPDIILREIGLKTGDTFMDIGCGAGFFALPAARIVGNWGMVYGVDINSESINALKRAAEREGLHNIILKTGEAETTTFSDVFADIIFFGIDLHDFRDPAQVLQNARKMIKPDGQLIDLDWKKEATPFGPPLEIRFDEAKATGLIEAAGFLAESIQDYGLYFYLVTAKVQI